MFPCEFKMNAVDASQAHSVVLFNCYGSDTTYNMSFIRAGTRRSDHSYREIPLHFSLSLA